MSEETEKNQTADGVQNNEEFNRTVVISKPRIGSGHSTPLHKITSGFVRKRQELEDIIGGVDVSQYTNVKPDTTGTQNAPLSNLDTRYWVLEEFAKGGHATVSIARDKNLQRVVAIKSLKKDIETKEEFVKSFVSEAKVTAQLDHPAIIPVYGLTGDDSKGIHLSMKLVNGRTLRDYLRNLVLNYRIRGIKTFDERALLQKRLELFLRVCDAIAYAHHRNIMHGDLKPENIMLGEYMEVYVMDWGLAREITQQKAPSEEEGRVTGTPRYFAPEILRGKPSDARADIFTLGLILQEIVTLQFAVKGRDENEFMDRILNDELEPIEHLFHWRIDKVLKAIIRKATAYQVEDRYQSVSELAEDLRSYLGGFSVSAYPDTPLMKIGRFANRHRKEFLLGFMAVLLLSSAVTVYSIYRQMRAAEEIKLREKAIDYIYDRTGRVAEHLNMTTFRIEEELMAISRIAAYLLTYNTSSPPDAWSQNFRPSMGKIGKTEKGMFYSPYYKRMVSLDYGIYTMAPTADEAQCKEFMRRVYPILTKMKNIVLGSKSEHGFFERKNFERLKTDYLYHGFPVRAVYIGSTSGVKLLYPWRGNYARNVDPRQRTWYKNAVQKIEPTWGKPYMDIDSVSGLSIPCSMPIHDLSGKLRGAVGIDLSVNRLTNSILGRGNTGDYVIEKAVINLKGETLFSSKSEFFNKRFDPDRFHQDVEFHTPLYQAPYIRRKILKHDRGYGTFIVRQSGKEIIYSYAHLSVLNMYFVVSADYEKLLRHVKEHRQ